MGTFMKEDYMYCCFLAVHFYSLTLFLVISGYFHLRKTDIKTHSQNIEGGFMTEYVCVKGQM